MSARADDVFEPEFEKDTLLAEFPTTVQLMDGIYRRRVQPRLAIEVITDTSSGGSPSGIPEYTATHLSPTEPDAKLFGDWLENYKDHVQEYAEQPLKSRILTSSTPCKLYGDHPLANREENYKAAIELLQSWIDEQPDDQQVSDLARLKETIDEQRTEERKLFK